MWEHYVGALVSQERENTLRALGGVSRRMGSGGTACCSHGRVCGQAKSIYLLRYVLFAIVSRGSISDWQLRAGWRPPRRISERREVEMVKPSPGRHRVSELSRH